MPAEEAHQSAIAVADGHSNPWGHDSHRALDLIFVAEHTVDRFPISNSHSTTVFDYSVASDASGVGHYVYSVGPGLFTLASRAFSREEQSESSTWREVRRRQRSFRYCVFMV